jgi:non-heme chloroperoxidase
MTGLNLNYIEKGQGRTLLLVPGWSQTAQCYQKQIDGLSDRYRVIAVDMRGHGDSPKPSTGYRIARLAADLHDFILAHDLRDIALGGHSMGASIIWSYLEQFGADRIAKLIYIDQAPMVTNGCGIEGTALKETGAAGTPEGLYATAGAIIGNQAAVLDRLKAFFSPTISDADVAFNKAEALKMPAEYAARLLVDHGTQD